jgi:hypothetical protein
MPIRLAIEGAGGPGLAIEGRVAWAETAARLRAGVAFDRLRGGADPGAWFRELLSAQPGLAWHARRAPERLHLDAPLYLLPPPRRIVDLTDEEGQVLRLVDNGITPRTLMARRPRRAEATARTLFSLFEKRALTLAMGQSAPAWQWRVALGRAAGKGSPDPGPLPGEAPPPAARAAAERPAPPPVLRRETPLPRTPSPVFVRATPRPMAAPLANLSVRPAHLAPRPAAAAPRIQSRPRPMTSSAPAPASRLGRSPEAQELLDQARAVAERGNHHGAIGLLRRALQLSPDDQEIAALLGQLAFGSRRP